MAASYQQIKVSSGPRKRYVLPTRKAEKGMPEVELAQVVKRQSHCVAL